MIIFWILFGILSFILLVSWISFYLVEHKRSVLISQVTEDHVLYEDGRAFLEADKEVWAIETFDGLHLEAWYLRADKETNKTVIVANGYHSVRDRFAAFGWLFHKLGYNVLMPGYRASAEAEGKYIGFGWLDKRDYSRWIGLILSKNSQAEIAQMGVSMGAATTMMLSGEDLPPAVKCFIADCGYDNLWNQLKFKAWHDFRLPPFPILYVMSALSKILAGYSYSQASSMRQLVKNKRPILFIHGEEDDFVPYAMLDKVVAATKSPKEVLRVPKARHARSYEQDPETYRDQVQIFLAKHL